MRHEFSTLSGLGDAVYAYPVIKHFSNLGPVKVHTKYPEVFKGLGNVEFSDTTCGVRLAYRRAPGENFYAAICQAAGVSPVFSWGEHYTPETLPTVNGKPICIVKEPCTADMHRRSHDFSMAPWPEVMQAFISRNKDLFYFVSVGNVGDVYRARLTGIDERAEGLSVSKYLTLCASASAFVSQICHLVPIAQGLGRRLYLFPPANNIATNTRNVNAESVIVPRYTNYEVIQ